MSASLAPLRQIVVVNLTQDATLAALVSGRITGRHQATSEADDETYPLVVVDVVGGHRQYQATYQAVPLEVWAYSRVSADEAAAVYDAAHNALHAQRLTLDSVPSRAVYLQEIERPGDGYNEVLRAWYVRGRYTMRGV